MSFSINFYYDFLSAPIAEQSIGSEIVSDRLNDLEEIKEAGCRQADLERFDRILSAHLCFKDRNFTYEILEKITFPNQALYIPPHVRALSQELNSYVDKHPSQSSLSLSIAATKDEKLSRRFNQAQLYALQVEELEKIGGVENDNNQICTLGKLRRFRNVIVTTDKPYSILKGSARLTHQYHNARLDAAVWKIAKELKVSRFFAPCFAASLSTQTKQYEGLFQIYVPGQMINNFEMNATFPWKKEDYNLAVAISIFFGMFDAHLANIIVRDKDGSLCFFDNNRSFPNSNDYIQRSQTRSKRYHPSYFSAFLYVAQSYYPWAQNETIKAFIQSARAVLPKVREHLSLSPGEKPYPKSWLDLNRVMHATEERVDRMEAALEKSQTPLDFILNSEPSVKFLFSLVTINYFFNMNGEELIQFSCSANAAQDIFMSDDIRDVQKIAKRACRNGCSLQTLRSIAKKADSYQELIEAIKKYTCWLSKTTNDKEYQEFISLLRKTVADDFKDVAEV